MLQNLYQRLIHCVKASNALPTVDSDDEYYYLTRHHPKDFSQRVASCQTQVEQVLSNIYVAIHTPGNLTGIGSETKGHRTLVDWSPTSENLDSKDALWLEQKETNQQENIHYISETTDELLEQVDKWLNESSSSQQQGSSANIAKEKPTTNDLDLKTTGSHRLFKDNTRPQDHFVPPVDNAYETSSLSTTTSIHPYQTIIENLATTMTMKVPVIHHKHEEQDREYRYIDTVDDLKAFVEQTFGLTTTTKGPKCRLLAVDLENHSYLSYQGFVCLMQLSTPDNLDVIVDVLALRSHIGEVLGPVFHHQDIIKVFHGADQDIVWLQRCFDLYVVNCFDTGQAARVLDYPGFSLAYLLQLHCAKRVDKSYQCADWRQRPLSRGMLAYARQDTQDLLYIYSKMLRECAKKEVWGQVSQRSNTLCLQVYTRVAHVPTADAILQWFRPLARKITAKRRQRALKWGSKSSSQQQNNNKPKPRIPGQHQFLIQLVRWRDAFARQEDTSLGYVLPNQLIVTLVEELPRTLAQFQQIVGSQRQGQLSQNLELQQQVWSVLSDVTSTPESPTNKKEVQVEKSNTDVVDKPPQNGDKPPKRKNVVSENDVLTTEWKRQKHHHGQMNSKQQGYSSQAGTCLASIDAHSPPNPRDQEQHMFSFDIQSSEPRSQTAIVKKVIPVPTKPVVVPDTIQSLSSSMPRRSNNKRKQQQSVHQDDLSINSSSSAVQYSALIQEQKTQQVDFLNPVKNVNNRHQRKGKKKTKGGSSHVDPQQAYNPFIAAGAEPAPASFRKRQFKPSPQSYTTFKSKQ